MFKVPANPNVPLGTDLGSVVEDSEQEMKSAITIFFFFDKIQKMNRSVFACFLVANQN